MTSFQMIKYHGQSYPREIPLCIEEIAAHMDIQQVSGTLGWSLHTEYSYGKRTLASTMVSKYGELVTAHRDQIPQLWKSEQWASQFADFVLELAGGDSALKVVEIHPPFNDYTDFSRFICAYSIFESKLREAFPAVEILIENRCGSIYRGGKFLISKIYDLYTLCENIESNNLSLKIALDIPQIYTVHRAETEKAYIDLLYKVEPILSYVGGVHLWGKRISESGRKVAHCGDLNSYFVNPDTKTAFLTAFADCFNDNCSRKMVLEVNSGNEDLRSIISDLEFVGVKFV